MTTAHRLAERVEAVRVARGMSVKTLAETTGIADKTLRRRLIQPGQFTYAEFDSICHALQVDPTLVLDFNTDVDSLTRRAVA